MVINIKYLVTEIERFLSTWVNIIYFIHMQKTRSALIIVNKLK